MATGPAVLVYMSGPAPCPVHAAAMASQGPRNRITGASLAKAWELAERVGEQEAEGLHVGIVSVCCQKSGGRSRAFKDKGGSRGQAACSLAGRGRRVLAGWGKSVGNAWGRNLGKKMCSYL